MQKKSFNICEREFSTVCFKVAYHREGLAMRLGLGKVFALRGEPEGEEPRVSRLGSKSSISSTSSCSSTSWSRMHLTEYWPNMQSCRGQKKKFILKEQNKNKPNKNTNCRRWFQCQSSCTYQLLVQLARCCRLVKWAPSP